MAYKDYYDVHNFALSAYEIVQRAFEDGVILDYYFTRSAALQSARWLGAYVMRFGVVWLVARDRNQFKAWLQQFN